MVSLRPPAEGVIADYWITRAPFGLRSRWAQASIASTFPEFQLARVDVKYNDLSRDT